MARIAGVDLPRNKRGVISLTYVFGIGATRAAQILEQAGVDQNTKSNGLGTTTTSKTISNIITNDYKVEGDLRTEVQTNIKRLMDIGCYRGLRHRKGLPLRGQRTQTNARTRKGKTKTVANKKKVTK
ncbi:MAG: 30S ribosomal protein S13 [Lewinella sp.]|nr:30S ribosomal protein S13 [Lewinella sp.]